ncbi:MAG TPA: isocitrate lyase/phosphoenolpyruvate mutase family protein [Gaiellaceae bacterium]
MDTRSRFHELHAATRLFVMPNPWDVGSARLLESLGFEALATTSSGFAASLGRLDQHVSREELVAHVAAITAATSVPLNVDSENCFPDAPGGVYETVRQLREVGAGGCSIEDYDPRGDRIEDLEVAVARVSEAAGAAEGLVLTARCENFLHGHPDLDETIARLVAYRDAGAHCVYAPGLRDLDDIKRVVDEAGVPVNVLLLPNGPSTMELESVGVRRVSTGGLPAAAAYGTLLAAGRELLADGTSTYASSRATADEYRAAFG